MGARTFLEVEKLEQLRAFIDPYDRGADNFSGTELSPKPGPVVGPL